MEALHTVGVDAIHKLQTLFPESDELMLTFSHLGDPRNAFLLYFPIAYAINKSIGIKVLWSAVISEWLNAVFKWILYGERPYWWLPEHSREYADLPEVQQYKLTCETGPGSPSGHAMVTAAVLWNCVIYCRQTQTEYRRLTSVLAHILFFIHLSLVCVSRCFIATHFPHQVIAGTATGIALAEILYSFPLNNIQLPVYFGTSLMIVTSVLGLYKTIELIGLDPSWSMSFAVKWCARKEWIHLDTNLFFAVMRDAGSLLGVGVAVWKTSSQEYSWDNKDLKQMQKRTAICIVAVIVSLLQECLPLYQSNLFTFYSLAFFKHFMLMLFVVSMYVFGAPQKRVKNG